MFYTLIRKSFGGMESETVNSKEKIPSTGGSEEVPTHDTALHRTVSLTHYRLGYSSPRHELQQISRSWQHTKFHPNWKIARKWADKILLLVQLWSLMKVKVTWIGMKLYSSTVSMIISSLPANFCLFFNKFRYIRFSLSLSLEYWLDKMSKVFIRKKKVSKIYVKFHLNPLRTLGGIWCWMFFIFTIQWPWMKVKVT